MTERTESARTENEQRERYLAAAYMATSGPGAMELLVGLRRALSNLRPQNDEQAATRNVEQPLLDRKAVEPC